MNKNIPPSVKPKLIHVFDPMCSWCWGYRPTWEILEAKLSETVDIQYYVGGLAPDSDEAMPIEMQRFLQQTWRKISNQLGTEFNFDFWQECLPRRSTYPACRAIIAARDFGAEQQMVLAIQQGYYLQAMNPSNNSTLVNLAASIGLEADVFEKVLLSSKIDQQLFAELALVKQLPVQGFPSLVLMINDQTVSIDINYENWQISYETIMKHIANN